MQYKISWEKWIVLEQTIGIYVKYFQIMDLQIIIIISYIVNNK